MRTALYTNVAISDRLRLDVAEGRSPRRDFFELADALPADLLHPGSHMSQARVGRSGADPLSSFRQARFLASRSRDYDLVVSGLENVGVPLALLLKVSRRRVPHVMITHYMDSPKKALPFRLFGLHSHIDRIVCYGQGQAHYLVHKLGVPSKKVVRVFHAVDHHFWRPLPVPVERLICSAGLEARDYPTLIEAARGLNVRLVIAASSPWSSWRHRLGPDVPDFVDLVQLSPLELRELYARAQVVAVPVHNSASQAGSLVIYEGMAMGKAVVASRTEGQGDIMQHGRNGLYVPPGDVGAMRAALQRLLDNPVETRLIGEQARQTVDEGLNLDTYVRDMRGIVEEVAREHGLLDG